MKKRSVLAGWLCSYILIMMIPIVTVFVNYAWSMKVIRKEILEANNLVLDNLGDEIDRYLNREMAFESQEGTFPDACIATNFSLNENGDIM